MAHSSHDALRKQQLVHVLQGAVEALGPTAADEGDPLPADAVVTWSEHDLLKHFGQRIRSKVERSSVSESSRGSSRSAVERSGGSTGSGSHQREVNKPAGFEHCGSVRSKVDESAAVSGSGCTNMTPAPAASSVSCAPDFQEPSPAALAQWLPALARVPSPQHPRLRIVCFHAAGCAEDMFSSEGTGVRRAPSPLLDWCRANDGELLAVQAPGRNNRLRDPFCSSARQLGAEVLEVLGARLQRPASGDKAVPVPWVVVSHSMGCWVAFEMLRLMRHKGLPMPAAWFVSAMPAPDIPECERPWRQQRSLDEEQFKAECRAWDINEVVFSPAMWQTYQPMLRADFRLFDEYQLVPILNSNPNSNHSNACPNGSTKGTNGCGRNALTGAEGAGTGGDGGGRNGCSEGQLEEEGQVLFSFPVHTFWGAQDRRVTQRMVQEWRRFTTGAFSCSRVDGNHLWPLHKEPKTAWLASIAEHLKRLEV